MLLTRSPRGVRGALLDGQAPPRVRHAPRVRRNSWEDVSDLVAAFGLVLDEWQENVLAAGLGERSDGRWAARQVGCSVPRQNGKTMLIVARALAGVLLFDERLIVVSAHRQDTARETFYRLVQIIEDNPALESRVDFIGRSEQREYIRMKTGQEVRFKSRQTGAGRGFSCNCLLLDEAQILGEGPWSSILPTLSAQPNPQAWLFGTPPRPDEDEGDVFTRLRRLGVEGKESRLAWVEWSADPDDPPDDPVTWAKANPAYGSRIEYEAVAAEFAAMAPAQFSLERLGVWPASGHRVMVAAAAWADLVDVGPGVEVRPSALAVDMSHDRWISVAACWIEGESAHVEEVWAGWSAAGAVEWITGRVRRRTPVVVDGASPACALAPELVARRVDVRVTNGPEMARACGLFVDRVTEGRLTHGGQESIGSALAGARARPIRNAGGWGWDRSDPGVNLAPLVAATLAVFGACSEKRRSRRAGGSVMVMN